MAGCPGQGLATRPALPRTYKHLRPGRARPREGACSGAPRRVAGDPGTQHAVIRGEGEPECPDTRDTQGAVARGLATRRASRASWPVGGSYIGAVPATYIPARPEAVPSARGASAAPPPPPTRYPSRFAAAHLPRAAASGLDRAAQAGGPETLHIHSQSRAAPGSEAGATRTSVNPRRVC